MPRLLSIAVLALLVAWPAVLRGEPPTVEEAIASGIRSPFPNLFIQQEHEGNLTVESPPDARGNLFGYYEPVENDPGLAEEANRSLSWPERTIYWLRRKTWHRGDPWGALTVGGKIRYLELLEERVKERDGQSACWNGPECRLLKRRAGAPKWVAENPHMELHGLRGNGVGSRPFLYPEIVTARDQPALTAAQAVSRARQIVTDTGHGGVHFHVFVRLPPERLKERLPYLTWALARANDGFFLDAALDNYANVQNDRLGPWTRDKSAKVEDIVKAGGAEPHIPDITDPHNPKAANLAFRYWGIEDGKAVVSLEWRGVSLPWVVPKSAVEGELPEGRRNYGHAERGLGQVVLLARGLLAGAEAPEGTRDFAVTLEEAEKALETHAARRGIRKGSYLGLREFSRLIHGDGAIPQGFLLPFVRNPAGSDHGRRFLDGYLRIAAEAMRHAKREEYGGTYRYELWSVYRDWAKPELVKARGELYGAYPEIAVAAAAKGFSSCVENVSAMGR